LSINDVTRCGLILTSSFHPHFLELMPAYMYCCLKTYDSLTPMAVTSFIDDSKAWLKITKLKGAKCFARSEIEKLKDDCHKISLGKPLWWFQRGEIRSLISTSSMESLRWRTERIKGRFRVWISWSGIFWNFYRAQSFASVLVIQHFGRRLSGSSGSKWIQKLVNLLKWCLQASIPEWANQKTFLMLFIFIFGVPHLATYIFFLFDYWMNQDWVQESILAWLWHCRTHDLPNKSRVW